MPSAGRPSLPFGSQDRYYRHVQTPLSGEKDDGEFPQPGGRAPAPGDLALVQAFVNTHYDLTAERGGEILIDPEALRTWFTARGLIDGRHDLDADDLERARMLRQGLRALAFLNNGQSLNSDALDAMHRASAGAATEIRIERDGPRFVQMGRGIDAAIGALLAITARAMIDRSWLRFKACPGRDCGWAFYDHSRNQSARWCSMKVCGDREKARAYYQRKTAKRA
jgi:predicted RNA-binding Zn ribbon-like protein